MKKTLLFLFIVTILFDKAQSQFAPPAGQPGSTAIYKDSIIIKEWATNCVVQRGFLNIMEPSLGLATFGNPEDACGSAGQNGVVSLGDGGIAIVTFQNPITNGTGADFAIFENAFNDSFLELAFVEVSSDGFYFARFPSVSLTQNQIQINGFGTIDATKIHNLAGKYRANYGTPFNLDDINDLLVNKNHITHVKIFDVTGCIQKPYAAYDSQGNIINDPFPTPFETGGFDLDAVGVIHPSLGFSNKNNLIFSIFPNPCANHILIQANYENKTEIKLTIFNQQGITVYHKAVKTNEPLNISNIPDGLLFLQIIINNHIINKKIIKKSK